MIERRIVELEIKLAYQEDLLAELNNIVAQQQQKMADLEKICKLLYERMENMLTQDNNNIADQKPPHY